MNKRALPVQYISKLLGIANTHEILGLAHFERVFDLRKLDLRKSVQPHDENCKIDWILECQNIICPPLVPPE